MGFTGRYPWVVDAHAHGFTVGHREDSGFQLAAIPNADVPLGFLDNDFRDPDLDRFVQRVHTLTPEVAVVGDAYTPDDAVAIQTAVDDLPTGVQAVAVPKCQEAFDVFDDVVLGYPNGYSTIEPAEYSTPVDWRDRSVHLLGGNPHSQYRVLQQLTQPTLDGRPPADIVGVDGNGVIKAAYVGEYWTPDGYRRADQLSVRATVSQSLQEVKGFWQNHGLWPASTPLEEYGPAVLEPDDRVYTASGGDIRTQAELETAYLETYDDELTRAYESTTAKQFVEYRDELL